MPLINPRPRKNLLSSFAASKDKKGILKFAQQDKIIDKPNDPIRESYVLDFLQIPEPYHNSESKLEKCLIKHLQHFLLELGKGFAFLGSRKRL